MNDLPLPLKKRSGFFLTFYYQYDNITYMRICAPHFGVVLLVFGPIIYFVFGKGENE